MHRFVYSIAQWWTSLEMERAFSNCLGSTLGPSSQSTVYTSSLAHICQTQLTILDLWKTLVDGTIVICPDNSLICGHLVSQWLLPYLTLNNLYSIQIVKYKFKQFRIYSTDSANRKKIKHWWKWIYTPHTGKAKR